MNKLITLILPLIVLTACNSTKKATIASSEQTQTISANHNKASLRSGNNYWHKVWTISPDLDPDVWYVKPELNKSIKATFITDIDSISYNVFAGQAYDFNVKLPSGEIAHTQIKGVGEQAYFSEEYQDKYRNKTVIEIPEVYELINVLFALTEYADENENSVSVKDVEYIDEVLKWFAPYKKHPVVQELDSVIRQNFNMYFALKMDAYMYEFDNNKIVSKGIYNVISNDIGESLLSADLLTQIEDFSKQSKFRSFYKNNQSIYNDQVKYYEEDIGVAKMQKWLSRNFPKTNYDCFKVIFSPIVAWNQSARWFDNYGFKEAQAHVNFPYPRASDTTRTKIENIYNDGSILFTEFNHAFINPEAEQYFNKIIFREAFADISLWADKDGVAEQHYRSPESIFNEMMNWSLVSLYFIDNLPSEGADKLIKGIEKWQTERRGFTHFEAFNKNLIKLYEERASDETVADLYPKVLNWAKEFKETKTK